MRSIHDAQLALAESLDRRMKSKEDVPLLEDFPLAPEEETTDFQHMATGLQFRSGRAFDHWRGNMHLTLAAIIVRTVEEGIANPRSSREVDTGDPRTLIDAPSGGIMSLEASTPRQLGEEGLVVFWRDGREPRQRDGLTCVLSMCPQISSTRTRADRSDSWVTGMSSSLTRSAA